MSISELFEIYKSKICVLCSDKKYKDCNIRVYEDNKNRAICCKCVYFNSDKKVKHKKSKR